MSFIRTEEENENHSLSQSNNSSNNNIKEIPFLNKEQILINWINTIKQPHCLLINKLTDNDIIENGIVFIEILSNFLNYFGMGEFNPDKRLTKYEKVNLVISSLIELNKGDYYDYNLKQKILFFYNRISHIFINKKLLISFLELLKEIYDKFGVCVTEGNIDNLNHVNTNNLNNIEVIKESSENEINQIPQINFQKENLSIVSNSNNTTNPNNVHQNISNLNINLISEGVISNNENNIILTPQYNTNNNTINNKNEEEILEYKYKKNKIMTLIKDSCEKKKINHHSYNSNDNILYNNIINSLRTQKSSKQSKINFSSLSPSHSITLSISPVNYNSKNITMDEISNKNNSSNNNSFSLNKKKVENIKEEKLLKNEISLTFGIMNKSPNKILQYKIPIYNFIRPTNAIIQISLNKENIIKYIPKINKNIKLKNENIFQPKPIKSFSCDKKQISKLSESAKNSIKLWLSSLKIINNLNSSDLAIIYLCHNGTLFNDIINRCSSSNSNLVIKGIIREPFTPSQCKINLKKFFDYVFTNYKLLDYLKNYTNSINDIINKDENICFGILFGLFRYFNKDYKNMQSFKISIPKLNLKKKEKNNFFINEPISTNTSKTKNMKKQLLNNKTTIQGNNSPRKILSSRNDSNEKNNSKSRRKSNSYYYIKNNKNKEKENEDFSNFLNGLSLNSEYNGINKNVRSTNNLIISKSKKPSNLNSSTVSRCSSIVHSPSNNSSFLNFDYFNYRNNTRNNFGNYSYKNNAIKINNFLNKNKRNIPNLKLVKKKSNSQRGVFDNNHKCFLLFRSSNISRMKNETKKFLKN